MKAADENSYVPGRLLVGLGEGRDRSLQNRILAGHGAGRRGELPALGAAVVSVPEAASEAVMASLRGTGAFTYVERDYYAHTAAVPNDPSYGFQWHLPRIQTPEAWNLTTGSAGVVVGVIDSGVWAQHPDLGSKLVPGWNFVNQSPDTSDRLGHGTAVAGTVAAASNNNVGVAGVSWASQVMPLVVVDDNDFAAYSDIAAAIQYAADHGVRVINISIGGLHSSQTLQNAVDYAWSKGALLFAAAMNQASTDPYYPAACNHVMGVAATDSNDHLSSFSDYGNWVTISAPGTNILTTSSGGGYGYWSGTSFASPIVAGVAALCLAENPALTNAAVVAILKQTAEDLGAPGFDTTFGWGRVNAFRAVWAARDALPKPAAPTLAPQPAPAQPSGPVDDPKIPRGGKTGNAAYPVRPRR